MVARAAGYKAALEEHRVVVGRKAARAAKVKKKLRVTLGGYAARVEELGKRLSTASVAIREATVEYGSFVRLWATESAMKLARVETLKEQGNRKRGRALRSLCAREEGRGAGGVRLCLQYVLSLPLIPLLV